MSSSGQVIITGIVMLGNARAVEPQKGNRNIAFDVTIPVKDGAKDTLALFRYFTPENKVDNLQKIWSVQFTQAYIVAKVCVSDPIPTITLIFNRLQLCQKQESLLN